MRPGRYPNCEIVVGEDGAIAEVRAGSAVPPNRKIQIGSQSLDLSENRTFTLPTSTSFVWSPVTRSASRVELSGTGDFSVGVRFQPIVPLLCTGVRFRRSAVVAGTLKGSLWNSAGTRLAHNTVAVAGSGTYTVQWTGISLTAHQRYVVSVYDLAGALGYFNVASETDSGYPAMNLLSGPLLYEHMALYREGDAWPTIGSPDGATALYGVEPVWE